MYLKEFIKSIRKINRLTQSQLAERLGVSLDAIKKIESGQTQYPSSKLLKALCEYEGMKEEECLAMILFNYGKDVLPDNPRSTAVAISSFPYLARLYLDGWNVQSYLPTLEVHDLGKYVFIAELTKKRDSNYSMLIDHADKYHNFESLMHTGPDMQVNIFIFLFTVYMSLDKKYTAIQIICDENDLFQKDLFWYMQSFTTDRVRLPITFILYNGHKCEIVAEHKVCI